LPGKNVAVLLAKKFAEGGVLTTPSSLPQDVSCRNKKTRITAAPTSPAVQFVCAAIRADNVGPATLPKSKHKWNTVRALPELLVNKQLDF
jgi:uncharacterized protein (DUF3084 family)